MLSIATLTMVSQPNFRQDKKRVVNRPKAWQNLMKLKNVTKQMGKCLGSKQSTPNIFNTYSYLENYKSRLSRNWHFLLALQFFCVNF